jgi:hypothetical protein
MERDDSRQLSHFMNCRLCQPNLFSGIFTLFGASADGRGKSLLIIPPLFELTTKSMKRKKLCRIRNESGKLYAVLFKLPKMGRYFAYEIYDDDNNCLLHYRLLIFGLTILHLEHSKIHCTVYSLHTKICYKKDNPFSCLKNCHTIW